MIEFIDTNGKTTLIERQYGITSLHQRDHQDKVQQKQAGQIRNLQIVVGTLTVRAHLQADTTVIEVIIAHGSAQTISPKSKEKNVMHIDEGEGVFSNSL